MVVHIFPVPEMNRLTLVATGRLYRQFIDSKLEERSTVSLSKVWVG